MRKTNIAGVRPAGPRDCGSSRPLAANEWRGGRRSSRALSTGETPVILLAITRITRNYPFLADDCARGRSEALWRRELASPARKRFYRWVKRKSRKIYRCATEESRSVATCLSSRWHREGRT